MERRKKRRRERREKERRLRELTPYVKPCAMYDKDNFILGGGVGVVGDPARPFSYAEDPEKGGGESLHSTDLFIFFYIFLLFLIYFFLIFNCWPIREFSFCSYIKLPLPSGDKMVLVIWQFPFAAREVIDEQKHETIW